VEEIFVSSDSSEILQISADYGAIPLKRPKELAEDTTLTSPVIEHAIECIESSFAIEFDNVVVLQPTSPLRTAKHIDAAVETLYLHHGSKAVISAVKVDNAPFKYLTIRNGFIKGLVSDSLPFERRQDLPPLFAANGAIYLVDKQSFKENGSLLPNYTLPFIMELNDSFDIDTEKDFELAEKIMSSLYFTNKGPDS
jgi:N-acylneuraminate cytidylyltransferase